MGLRKISLESKLSYCTVRNIIEAYTSTRRTNKKIIYAGHEENEGHESKGHESKGQKESFVRDQQEENSDDLASFATLISPMPVPTRKVIF